MEPDSATAGASGEAASGETIPTDVQPGLEDVSGTASGEAGDLKVAVDKASVAPSADASVTADVGARNGGFGELSAGDKKQDLIDSGIVEMSDMSESAKSESISDVVAGSPAEEVDDVLGEDEVDRALPKDWQVKTEDSGRESEQRMWSLCIFCLLQFMFQCTAGQ